MIHANGAVPHETSHSAADYEPWLFQAMLEELSHAELGVDFIYTLLDLAATRYGLTDAIVTLSHELVGTQTFRLGRQSLPSDFFLQHGSSDGLYTEPDVLSEGERDAIRTACQLAMALHLARYGAVRDPLTNLANKRNFESLLESAAARSSRYGWAFTLVVIDLNGFKAVNDRLGHAQGDDLLRRFGFALRSSLRKGDSAARIGGDEFAVILSNAESREVPGFLERLQASLVSFGGHAEFSVGTATSPRDSIDPDELFRIADSRLYQKKGINLE